MQKLTNNLLFYFFLISFLFIGNSLKAQETRLLRNPAISNNNIAFLYAGDLWLANLDGSNTKRITAFEGVESDPHFSPDGQYLAFTGQYDGNTDVYVIPIAGGDPKRLTWHPGPDFARGWTQDGKNILFTSGRAQAPFPEADQLWMVSTTGSTPTQFIIPRAVNGKFSPDGTKFVFQEILPWEDEFRNYRGGQNNPLKIFDLKTYQTNDLPWENSRDMDPVWVNDDIYFLSDRDFGMNIWVYNTLSKSVKQVSFFKEFDCKNLQGNADNLIFENGGYLYTLGIGATKPNKLNINVVGDFPWTRPQYSKIDNFIESVAISPTGKRIVVSARGEVLSIPASKGDVRNLTNSQGIADRTVSWSPDGKSICWFSDEGGEYQLVISDQFGKEKRKIKIDNPTFYYRPSWSPDSKYLSFYNEDRTLWMVEVSNGTFTKIDNEGFAHPQHVIYGEWAPDSKWLAYTKRLNNEFASIFVYSLEQKKSFQLTDGMSDCQMPAWDESGKYLYFAASTDYGLNVGWLDMSSYDHPVNRAIYMAVLSKDDASPIAPESDEEEVKKEEPKKEITSTEKGKKSTKDKEEKEAVPKEINVKIDFDGLAQRIIDLPIPVKNYQQLETAKEGVLLFGESISDQPGMTLHRFTLKDKKVEKVVEGVVGFEVSSDRNKYVYVTGNNQYVISDPTQSPNLEKEMLKTGGIEILIDPVQEWKQIFREAWRYQRDYFYVDNVHGLDMDWAYKTYAPWIDHVKHRSDLNYLLDIFSGETSIGHSFVRGGQYPEVKKVQVGLLGADIVVENNRFRIKKIYNGENWNPNIKSPLSGPGINVKEGDYLISINGVELNPKTNFYSYFSQTAGKQTPIKINSSPSTEGAKELIVIPVSNETSLRRQDWVEGNRRKVDELSGGKIAYVWLPDTGGGGYANFNRYYFAQKDKKGVIIDERFNHGGSIADYIVDLLSRDLLGYFNNPIGNRQPFTAPNGGIFGPKVMIVNESAGSGGDMLPYMFKMRKIGPIVGKTTWGGLVGIWDVPGLIDGGSITAPRGGFYNVNGEWDVENKGVSPDIFVVQDPKEVIEGHDPQLEKAVNVAMELLKTQEVKLLPQPKDPIRVFRPK